MGGSELFHPIVMEMSHRVACTMASQQLQAISMIAGRDILECMVAVCVWHALEGVASMAQQFGPKTDDDTDSSSDGC